MTSRAKGAAQAAPAVHWYPLPLDEEGPPKFAPRCEDGQQLLARLESGEVVPITVEHRHGVWFVGPDGEHVEADAIAYPPPRSRADNREAVLRERYDTIKLRLPLGYKARLQRLAEEDGYSASEWVATWIEMAEHEQAEWRARPPKRKAAKL